jgi:hypothetical protein
MIAAPELSPSAPGEPFIAINGAHEHLVKRAGHYLVRGHVGEASSHGRSFPQEIRPYRARSRRRRRKCQRLTRVHNPPLRPIILFVHPRKSDPASDQTNNGPGPHANGRLTAALNLAGQAHPTVVHAVGGLPSTGGADSMASVSSKTRTGV